MFQVSTKAFKIGVYSSFSLKNGKRRLNKDVKHYNSLFSFLRQCLGLIQAPPITMYSRNFKSKIKKLVFVYTPQGQ